MSTQENKSALRVLYEKLPPLYLIAQIIIGIFAAFWVLVNHQPETGDDIEHLHSAWLVSQGKVPYIDFFQHHNPLLWYLFAPVADFFAYDLTLFDVVRIISTLVMFGSLWVAAAIVRRYITQSRYAMLLCVATVFPSYVIFSGQDFRPDNYMVLAFMLGLYWLFAYLEQKRVRSLILSFAAFFISFLFMQKVIFLLAFVGVAILWLLYAKQIVWADFAKAMIFPLVGSVLFLAWLLSHDMLKTYWLANYIFNLYIPDVYGGLVEKTRPEFYAVSGLALGGCAYLLRRGNIAARIICLLWLAECVQRFFYFSLDRHYYYQLQILNAMLAGVFCWVLIKKWQWSAYLFVALSLWAGNCFYDYCRQKELAPGYFRYVTPKYVLEQTNRCDVVINGYGLTYGIFSKDATYYWNLNGQLDVIGNKIGLAPLPDLNAAVEKYLPRIIYTGPYWNERLHQKHIDVPVHQIRRDLRDKYYNQSLFMDIFILKPEYQNIRRCKYNAKTDSWDYFYKESRLQ